MREIYTVNDLDDYLIHWGIKGQKWGVRRYQNEDGTLTPEGIKHLKEKTEVSNNFRPHNDDENTLSSITTAGITQGKNHDTIKKGAKLGRIANSGEKIDSKRKYAYLTKNDSQSYSEMYDMIGLDMTKPISTYEYSASKNLKVKHADEVVKDAVKKYGDISIKQLYDNDLLEISPYFHKSGKLNADEQFIKEQSEKGHKWLNTVMEDHGQDLLSDYKKEGFDAIIDPEDVGAAEYPIILLDPKSSIKLEKEKKWFD